MRYAIKLGGALASLMVLGSCSSIDGIIGGEGPKTAEATPVALTENGIRDFPVKIGAPFTVGDATYTPADIANYDEVGYASYYGAEFSGKPTANGEVFLPAGVSAAHKTLPLPSYVEVTALDTGRTVLVRVNDRGPFANDRLIDLSEGAAQQLGMTAQGVSGVRVRRVNPPEQERAVLRAGLRASERIETPESLLRILRDKLGKQTRPLAVPDKPVPAPQAAKPVVAPPSSGAKEAANKPARAAAPAPSATPVKTTVAGNYVVQVAAFASRASADQLAKKLAAKVLPTANGKLFRVRLGPYASEKDAQRGLDDVRKQGYPQARVHKD